MILIALLFLQLTVKAECTLSCRDKPCSCCRTGECIKSGNKEYCTDCIDGFTGETCKEPCPPNCINCSQIFFPSNRTCFSCKNGYYNGRPYDILEYHVENDCGRSCKNGCAVCESYKMCTKCKIHFYMDSTNTCIECPNHCANCSSATSCISCLPNCKRCGLFASCQECHQGFYLEENICKSCYENNYTNEACLEELVPVVGPSSSSSKANIGLIVGLVICSVVAIGVCIIIFIIVRTRRKKRSNCCSSYSDRTQDQQKTSAIYEDENIELLSGEARRTTETRELASADKLIVLQMQRTFTAIQEKYGYMKISVDKNKVAVEGDPLDIENAFKEIDIKCGEIEQMRYKLSKSREWLIFFQKEHIVKYVHKKLEQKQLLGIWYINGTELTVFVHGKGNCENFKNTLLESVIEIALQVEKALFSSKWRCELLLYIQRIFLDKIDIFTQDQHVMVITCTDDVVIQVKHIVSEFLDGATDMILCEPGVCEFVSKYWALEDFDELREGGVLIITEAHRIKIRGSLENVVKCKEKLSTKLKDICSERRVLKRTGIITVLVAAARAGTISDIEMECRCVMMLPPVIDKSPTAMLRDYGDMDSQIQEYRKDSGTNAPPTCFQTRRHKIKIQLIQGDIGHQQVRADIIVVGEAGNLDRHSGSAFSTALKQGCAHPQTDYNSRFPNGIKNGEVAVILSADFNKLYLTSLPPWKEASVNDGKVLQNFMRECLRLADKFDKNSIAFSIMVTLENLGYPTDIVTGIVYGAVAEFDSSYSKTSLKEINVFEDDETIKTCIMCHLKKQERENRTDRTFIEDGTILTKLYEDSKYRMVKDGCAIGPLQLQVQIGDLLSCTTDAIVVKVGANINSKANVLHNNGVIITENAGLKAKHVMYVLLEDTLAGWRSNLVCCLEEAGKKDLKSVALPVFESGTGTQTFSYDGIGACLFAAIDDFTSKNPKSSVNDVRLVVPDSNTGCVPAIIAALQDRTTAVNSQWGISKIFKSQLGFSEHKLKESFVTVYSDETINIDRCFAALIDRIRMEFAEKIVDVDIDVIRSLKDKQINSIIDSDIVVDVMFNKTAGHFTISGP